MSNSVNGRVFGAIVFGLVLAFVPGAWLMASQTKTISAVEVQTHDGSTQVILKGAEDAMYTAFMRQDPPRLIIDLPNVLFDGVETPIAVGDGVVTDITLGAFGDPRVSPSMARVSIGLAAESQYEVIPSDGELVVALAAPGAPMAAAAPAHEASEVAVRDEPAVAVREEPGVEAREEVEVPAAPAASDDEAAESWQAAAEEPAPAAVEMRDEAEVAVRPEAEMPAAPAMTEASAPAVEPEPAAPVSRIVAVETSDGNVRVRSEGPVDNVDSFVLEEPDRIVIDFWGARNDVWPASQDVEHGAVSRVRVGEHADKVRVVLDLRAPAERHVVEPMADGVRVAIESASMVVTPIEDVVENQVVPAAPAEEAIESEPMVAAEPAPAMPEPEAAPAPAVAEPEVVEPEVVVEPEAAPVPEAPEPEVAETTPAMPEEKAAEPMSVPAPQAAEKAAPARSAVESVHFESLPAADRIVISLTSPVAATMAQPDNRTVIVDLPGVAIQPDQERRVDTHEFGGPVELFSAFRSPEIEGDNVRVVMKRSGAAAPSLVWAGAQLQIELPRPDGAPTPAAAAQMPAPAAKAAPAAPHSPMPNLVPAAITPLDQELFGGPADPASIDVLEEGGFSRDKEYRGRRISLDFKDADIGNILRLIAEVSDLNVIAGEEVGGKVTIRMVDVPWDQALDVVLMTKGLGFLRIGNILRIAPIDVLQREEEARLQERRAKEKLEDLIVKLQPVNYANVTEVADLVTRLLSPRGTVNVDTRTSTLIIKDIPTVIQEATALVKAIDTATPQVLIEAKIVEASLDFSRSLGARWGIGYNALGQQNGAQDLHLGDGSNSVVPGFGSGSQASNFVVANPIAAAVGTLTLGLLGLDDHLQLDLQLQAAESKNKGKVISSPRVVTLDNREAIIQQGVAIAFTAEDGDSINTSFVDAVLELKVKPHITSDRSIIMDIKVSRNAPQLSDADGAVVGIAKNETKTEALVRDGQTMVLGGIYTVDKGRGRTKMPYLADIPVIGVAFRNHTQTDIRRELLVFVTPRIVQGLPAGS